MNKKNADWTFEDSVIDEINVINKEIIDDDTDIGVKILRDYLDYLLSGEANDDDEFYYAQAFVEGNVANRQSYHTNGGRTVYNAIKYAAEKSVKEREEQLQKSIEQVPDIY
jgi:hypothetical protein